MARRVKRKQNIPVSASHSPFKRSDLLGPTDLIGRQTRSRKKISKYVCKAKEKREWKGKMSYVQECTWTNKKGKTKTKIVRTPIDYRKKYNKEYWLYVRKVGPKFPQPPGAKPRVIRRGRPKPR
jgi:hypothetical protein